MCPAGPNCVIGFVVSKFSFLFLVSTLFLFQLILKLLMNVVSENDKWPSPLDVAPKPLVSAHTTTAP